MSLKVIVLDVGRGLSAIIITPNRHSILIDCGCSSTNNPVDCLKFLYSLNITNDLLTYLIISHPHADHISAIERIHKECKPSYLTKRSDLDWSRVRKTNTENKSLDYYLSNFFPPINYYSNGQLPDWGDGFSIQNFWIPSIALIDIISATDNSYVNNSSIISIIKYKNYTFAFTGDIQKEGMELLLGTNKSLVNTLSDGVDFLICPHHGHSSGFCKSWFDTTGPTRIFNIVSERTKGENEDPSQTAIDKRYSLPEYSYAQNSQGERMISTKLYGSIVIDILENGKCYWETIK